MSVLIARIRPLRPAVLALFVAIFATSAGAYPTEHDIKREQIEPMNRSMQLQLAGVQYLLNVFQVKQFIELPDDSARAAWLDRFWASNDPTPSTPENEMRTEHTIRVNIARQFFGREEWPGWDRRGETFIRYGPPHIRARIPAEVTQRRVHAPGEMWYYARHDMVVVFRDESLNGNYIYAINALGATQDMTPELLEFLQVQAADRQLETIIPPEYLEFYRDAEFDPDSQQAYDPVKVAIGGLQEVRYTRPRMKGVTEDWQPLPRDYLANLPDNPSYQFFLTKAQEKANRFEETVDETPSSYPFNFKEERYPFFYGISQFKAGDGINRMEVNLELPLEPRAPDEVGDRRIFTATAVFFDADYKEVDRTDREIVVPVHEIETPEEDLDYEEDFANATKLFPAQLFVTLPESYYRMSVTVQEKRRVRAPDDTTAAPYLERESSYRSTISGRRYGGQLAISDLLFARRIAAAEKASPFARGALEVVPHPVRRYPRGAPVPVYFELYNLGQDDNDLSSYEIQYRIVPHSTRKQGFWDQYDNATTIVSSEFDGSGFSRDEPLHISFDSDNLAPGTYDLLITVKDIYWQTTEYRKATFKIVKN